MTTIGVMISMFVAAQRPTLQNCAAARDALINEATRESLAISPYPPHLKEDSQAIKNFVTALCKDGEKR